MIPTLLALLVAAAPASGGGFTLTSEILVERPTGGGRVALEPAKLVQVGDRLVFRLHYRNGGTTPSRDVVLSNPVPPALEFISTDDRPVSYSVDNGRTWGPLETLRVHPYVDDGVQDIHAWEKARASDVTDVRWTLTKPVAPGAEGTLSFRAKLR